MYRLTNFCGRNQKHQWKTDGIQLVLRVFSNVSEILQASDRGASSFAIVGLITFIFLIIFLLIRILLFYRFSNIIRIYVNTALPRWVKRIPFFAS